MNFANIPTGILIFFFGQTATIAWAIITMWFDVKSLKKQNAAIEEENRALRHQLKEVSDTLLIVKSNTDLLLLGRIKTGQK